MTRAPSDLLAARLATVRQHLERAGIDALLVTALPNVAYLTNLRATAAAALVTADDVWIVTDARYRTAAETLLASGKTCPGARLLVVERTYEETLAELLARRPEGRIGFEAAHLSVKRYEFLTRALAARRPGASLVGTERIVERVRLRKDPFELGLLRRAGRLLADLVSRVFAIVRPGRTERDVAAEIDWLIRQAGFEGPAFDTIVASGPHSALPHHRPGERQIQVGDLVLLDFGGVYDGYCVDLTRTVALGEPEPWARELAEAVAAAHAAALGAIRPGTRPSEVDEAARTLLHARGLGEYFAHGTGHGLGIEVHEEPRLTRRDALGAAGDLAETDPPLEPGMVFTIEPGLYRPGLGGVRLEDDVIVTDAGGEVITEAPRGLQVFA